MMGFSSSLCSYHCHYHQLDDFRNLRCCQKSFIIVAVTKGGPKRCALWTLLSASLSSVVIVIIIARLDITVMVDWAESTKLLTYLLTIIITITKHWAQICYRCQNCQTGGFRCLFCYCYHCHQTDGFRNQHCYHCYHYHYHHTEGVRNL